MPTDKQWFELERARMYGFGSGLGLGLEHFDLSPEEQAALDDSSNDEELDLEFMIVAHNSNNNQNIPIYLTPITYERLHGALKYAPRK
ncbi:MAG: hypothetical protein ACP5N3_01665 [Candidatus Nanoarchaeia archaeon]